MRFLILFLASIPSFGACAAGWSNGYQYCREIVIDHTKVPSTQTNYPVGLCWGAAAGSNCSTNSLEFATQANGGKLSNANGYDFIFTSDNAGTTPIAYERVAQDLAVGTAEMWVLISSLSSSADTKIYLFYHNTSVTTDQSNGTAVWDTNFLGVHHMQLLTGSYTTLIPARDSTSRGNNLPLQLFPMAVAVDATTGVIGGAADFSPGGAFGNSSSAFTDFPNKGGPPAAPFTLEGWFNINGDTSGAVYCFGDNNVQGDRWDLIWSTTTWALEGQNVFITFTGGTSAGWHRIVTILASGDTQFKQAKVYIDGVSQTVTDNFNGSTAVAPTYQAGHLPYTSGQTCGLGIAQIPDNLYSGLADELRLSKIERSQDWITTDYNNQSNPATFSTVGSEVALTGAGGPRAIVFK